MRINVMVNNLADADMSMTQVIDPNDLGIVNINSTGMLFFIQLQSNKFNLTNLSLKNLSKYVDIYVS